MAICQYLAIELATILMRSFGRSYFAKKAVDSKLCSTILPSNQDERDRVLNRLFSYAAMSCAGVSVLASTMVTALVLVFFCALSFHASNSLVGWISAIEAIIIVTWAFALNVKIQRGELVKHNPNTPMPVRALTSHSQSRALARFFYNSFWAAPRIYIHNLGTFRTVTFYKASLFAVTGSLFYLRTLL
jgi:hypothetical protein